MEDFAQIIISARQRAGLTQSQVAAAAGLTSSYLSFLENRKRPPPSDEVCARLAEILKIPPAALLEVAHLQRTPETIQRRVRALRDRLTKERTSRRRVLESLLSPFLFAGSPEFLEDMATRLTTSPAKQSRLRHVLAALGRRRQDEAIEISRLIDKLPERDRRLLLEALPRVLGERGRVARSEPPAPPLFYSIPAPGERPRAPFLLLWTPPQEGGSRDGELAPGDLLLVDPRASPEPEDIVVLRGREGNARLRRLVRDGPGWRLAAVRGAEAGAGEGAGLAEDRLEEAALRALLERDGLGTVVEIRRPLRRRSAR